MELTADLLRLFQKERIKAQIIAPNAADKPAGPPPMIITSSMD